MDKLQQAVDAVDKHGGISKAAKILGVPRQTLSGRYNKAVDQGYVPGAPGLDLDQKVKLDAKLKSIAKEKTEILRKYDKLLKDYEDQQKQIQAADLFETSLPLVQNRTIHVPRTDTPSESTAVICCSDLHYEEVVKPESVDGLNEYNTKIAQKRFDKVFQNGLKLVEMCRSKSNINTLVLWIGGDLITGYIHEELAESNSLSPIESSVEVYKMCVGAIDFLVENGDFTKIIVVTNVGNHGRTTKKMRISTSAENSFEWLIYSFLASHYADSEVVEFKLSKSYFNYLDVYDSTIRFHHGHYVRYAGGVGGITIPLNKAIAQWNQSKHADLDVFGHWHQRISSKNLVGNGSIIGYGPYSIKIKAALEKPQQVFFLMHPRHGKTVEAPIWVE